MKTLLNKLPVSIQRVVVFLSPVFFGAFLYLGDYTEYSGRRAKVASIDTVRHRAQFELPDGAVFGRGLSPEQYKRLEVGQTETLYLRGVDINETVWGDFQIVLSMVSFATAIALLVMWAIGFTEEGKAGTEGSVNP